MQNEIKKIRHTCFTLISRRRRNMWLHIAGRTFILTPVIVEIVGIVLIAVSAFLLIRKKRNQSNDAG